MIVIADSGSSKTSWACIDKNNTVFCETSGINPFFLGENEIVNLLKTEFTLDKNGITSIYFYGAGCALPEKRQLLFNTLHNYFDINSINIESDLLGAARSLCQNKLGIACILGTGSNSCYYNGNVITQNISPLGYVLGDEGSGAVLGKKLLADILKNQLSDEIQRDFYNTYHITAADVLENIYRKPFPNRFLAQFTKFIAKHIDKPEIEALVNNSFDEFFRRNVLQYKEALTLPIHFTGSIAYIFKANLEKVANKNNLQIGVITQSPINGLVEFHLNKIK